MVDTSKLVGERLAEFEQDRAESNRRYDHAFSVVLSHTSALELQEFSKLMGLNARVGVGVGAMDGGKAGIGSGGDGEQHQQHTNPMLDGNRRAGAVGGGAPATGAGTEFKYANPALDESGAAESPQSQLEVRSI